MPKFFKIPFRCLLIISLGILYDNYLCLIEHCQLGLIHKPHDAILSPHMPWNRHFIFFSFSFSDNKGNFTEKQAIVQDMNQQSTKQARIQEIY